MNNETESPDFDDAANAAKHRYDRPRRPAPWLPLIIVAIVSLLLGMLLHRVITPPHPTAAATQPADQATKWTCSMHPQVISDHPGECPICHMALTPMKSATASSIPGAITIDPVVVQNMGVRTAVVQTGKLSPSVRAVGYFTEPEPLHRDINLRVSGWIEKLHANIDGMPIEKGQPLFDLYSPELTVAVDELIAARRQRDTARDDASVKSFLDTSRRKLLQYGLAAEQLDGLAAMETAPRTVPILAPIGGHLTQKLVNEGAAVKAGDLVMRIASRDTMWVDARIFEQQIPLVSDGQRARVTTAALPGQTLTGKVMFIHPHLDPQTRSALARIEVPNEQMLAREGMFATVLISTGSSEETVLIPSEAVIDTGARQLAFVAGESAGTFEPRTLRLGRYGPDGTREVLEGVKVGERIVTSGQFLFDSESRLREAMAKHAAQGLADAPGKEKSGHTAH